MKTFRKFFRRKRKSKKIVEDTNLRGKRSEQMKILVWFCGKFFFVENFKIFTNYWNMLDIGMKLTRCWKNQTKKTIFGKSLEIENRKLVRRMTINTGIPYFNNKYIINWNKYSISSLKIWFKCVNRTSFFFQFKVTNWKMKITGFRSFSFDCFSIFQFVVTQEKKFIILSLKSRKHMDKIPRTGYKFKDLFIKYGLTWSWP